MLLFSLNKINVKHLILTFIVFFISGHSYSQLIINQPIQSRAEARNLVHERIIGKWSNNI